MSQVTPERLPLFDRLMAGAEELKEWADGKRELVTTVIDDGEDDGEELPESVRHRLPAAVKPGGATP
jgi:hypothetical protein